MDAKKDRKEGSTREKTPLTAFRKKKADDECQPDCFAESKTRDRLFLYRTCYCAWEGLAVRQTNKSSSLSAKEVPCWNDVADLPTSLSRSVFCETMSETTGWYATVARR